MKLSDKALRHVEAQTEPVPRGPLPGRGTATIDRYDRREVRAWWAARVADARAGRLARRVHTARPPRRTAKPGAKPGGRRGAVRLPSAFDDVPEASQSTAQDRA